MTSQVIPRRPTAASRSLAEQLQPLVRVHESIRTRSRVALDVAGARQRVRAGRAAFDAAEVLASAGDLARAFQRAAASFERAGLATTPQLTALRERGTDPARLALAWCNGESIPRDATLRLARSVAAVVGNALLAHAAATVAEDFSFSSWKWPQCPCCGGAPDLAILTDTRRSLVCGRCDTTWRTELRGCIGCGADLAPDLVRIPSPHLGYQVAICNACGRYIKERRGTPAQSLLVERMLTLGLDEAAQQRGLRA
ncbi:MAG TPA: formate dehydrogenase accessory protein FdhE [Gemmatimonadaceae bacterium]|nr:formate dehydrogenase accessory protein FdhE [Gemmatimonadaceae bacterium]